MEAPAATLASLIAFYLHQNPGKTLLKLDNYTLTKWTFLVLGILTLCFGLGWGIFRWKALQSWPSVTASVIKSELNVFQDAEDGTMYQNRITFSYEVDGHSYQSVSTEWGSSTDEKANRAIAARYAVGTTHRLLYNLGNPSSILVEAGYSFGYFKVTLFCLLLGGIFAGLGTLLFFFRRT